MKILISLLVLGIIIMIHELGHFLSAKFFKIPVSEFAIGMGPEVYTYEGEKTKYTFRSIPIGGFVNIEGMESDDDVEGGFNKRNPFVRFIVLFAGVFMNFLLAYIIVFTMTLNQGKVIVNPAPVVGNVTEVSKNTFKKGDIILKIGDKKIEKWLDIRKTMLELKNKDEVKEVTIKRDNVEKVLSVKLSKGPENHYYLGILPEYKIEEFGIIESLKISVKGFTNIFKEILNGFKMIVTGGVSRHDISGPIGIVNIVGEASEQGVFSIIWIMAILSVNVGIFNLLPFPALDGGRIIFVILEMFGIKVNKKVEEIIHRIGILILFNLINFITTNDFFNIVGK
ncbi:RIP metalloprotease [Fusobacterium sp.]|uniref:M50 family metallopeptidase n=1 Tax=Fusobacterium sp. TaxID=68766 RepID=UPI00260BC77E|nr:M50 family metallopeptidase [Fusobacterium sp.]